jgi:hypothetical protein
MTHEEIQNRLNEILAGAFNKGDTLAYVVGSIERTKSELLGHYELRDDPAPINSLTQYMFNLLRECDIYEALGLLHCNQLAVVDNVMNAVQKKQDLADFTDEETPE